MKIARIITRLNIGGPAIQAIGLSNALNDGDAYESCLITGSCGEHEGDMAQIMPVHCRVHHVPTLVRALSPLNDWQSYKQIFTLLKEEAPDVIHTHMAKAGLVGRLAAWRYRKSVNKPVAIIHTYHGHVFREYFSKAKTALFIAVERQLAKISQSVITISPTLRDDLEQNFKITPSRPMDVVPLGFDLARFTQSDEGQVRQELGIAADTPLVCAVGRLVPIKNHRLFLDVAKAVHQQRPDVRFVIIGDGEDRAEIEAQINTLGLTDTCQCVGWQRNMPHWYAAMDINVLTSLNEGTPVNIIEAGTAGVPTVCTKVGGIGDLIEDGKSGYLCEKDSKALSQRILELLEDENLRHNMGQAIQRTMLAQYSFDRLLADIKGIYHR